MATISQELTDLAEDIKEAYEAIDEKGGTLPEHKNTNNLADAIKTIGSPSGPWNIELKCPYETFFCAEPNIDAGYAMFGCRGEDTGTFHCVSLNQVADYTDESGKKWMVRRGKDNGVNERGSQIVAGVTYSFDHNSDWDSGSHYVRMTVRNNYGTEESEELPCGGSWISYAAGLGYCMQTECMTHYLSDVGKDVALYITLEIID